MSISAEHHSSVGADEAKRYEGVVAALSDDIASGRLREGGRLASERELSGRFDVSRVTVRRALNELVALGLVAAAARRGWFVTGTRALSPPLQSFAEWAGERGLTFETRVLRARQRPARSGEAPLLAVTPGETIFDLERLRLLEAGPLMVERSRVPLSRCPLLAETDFRTASLFAVLREHGGVIPSRVDSTVAIAAVPARQARLLGVSPGTRLLRFTEIVYDQDGEAFEIHEAWNRGEGYHWTSILDGAAVASRALRP